MASGDQRPDRDRGHEAARHATDQPALRALGRSLAVLLPAGPGPVLVLHDGGAPETLRRALRGLTLSRALSRLPAEAFDARGLCLDARPVLRGASVPVCAARRAEDGGLVVIASASEAAPPLVVVQAALDALLRRVGRGAATRSEDASCREVQPEGEPSREVPARFEPAPFEEVFENAAHGMAVIGADRRVQAVNRAGRRVLAEARLLREAGGRLRAADPLDDRRLGEALGAGAGREAPSAIVMAGRGGASGLRCEIGRIDLPRVTEGPAGTPGGAGGVRFLLTAVPVAASAPVEALLARSFGLTRAEARLAAQLVAGRDLRAAGERLGVSHHTARKYLQIAFAKMGVRRQSDLVRCALELSHEAGAA